MQGQRAGSCQVALRGCPVSFPQTHSFEELASFQLDLQTLKKLTGNFGATANTAFPVSAGVTTQKTTNLHQEKESNITPQDPQKVTEL